MNVARSGDYVAQTNFVQCVGASMQMMLNMIEPGADRRASTQLELQNLARTWSGRRAEGQQQRQGASVRGWTAGLNLLGAGPYKLVGLRTLEEAMATAALAIAETGKPVGLLVWRGRHAWVMSGFRATGDPRTDPGAPDHPRHRPGPAVSPRIVGVGPQPESQRGPHPERARTPVRPAAPGVIQPPDDARVHAQPAERDVRPRPALRRRSLGAAGPRDLILLDPVAGDPDRLGQSIDRLGRRRFERHDDVVRPGAACATQAVGDLGRRA